jgi:hypothetical protein
MPFSRSSELLTPMHQGVCIQLPSHSIHIYASDYLLSATIYELAPLRYAKEVCDSIVAKCLTGRPKTVEKAQAAFLLWVELEASEVFLVS